MGNWWMVKRGETRIGEHEGPELWKKSLAELSQMVFENPFTQLAPDFLRRRISRWPTEETRDGKRMVS